MKTIKLYERNAYQRNFSATVLSCEKMNSGYAVVLDQTAFFPEQGGQYADKGMLGDINVDDVQIVEGEIVHFLSFPLPLQKKIEGIVDWNVRFRRMQAHTGEHILSGTIYSMFGYNNVGFHLGEGYVTVDADGALTADMIKKVEDKANEVVWQDRAVTTSYPTLEELKGISYRSKIAEQEGLRLVTIEGCDVCACCAPHLSSTGQVGLIKVVAAEPRKKGTRLTVLFGKDAYENYASVFSLAQKAQQMLSATPETLLAEIKRTLDRLAEKERECKSLKVKCALSALIFTMGKDIEYAFTDDADFDVLRAVAPSVTAENVRFIFSPCGDTINYVAFSSTSDVRPYVQKINAALNGKGGGNAAFAQGKILAQKEDVRAFFLTNQ